MQKYRLTLSVIALLCVSTLLRAHHGSTPHFDPNDMVTVQGVVTELRFVNPHAFVYFDVVGADGESTQWRCELSGATTLRRSGWTAETLVAGQRIEMSGARARREDNACLMDSILLSDGSIITNQELRQASVRPVADPANTAPRPHYLKNGQPNLSGAWVSRVAGGGDLIRTNGAPEPTQAGLAAAETFDPRFDNPVIRCESGNIITDWYRQSHVNDIQQFADRVVLRYGYLEMQRTVFLNAEHPQSVIPGIEGHSIGWWEDDVLVVDTVGLAARALIPLSATMMSNQAHVIERFYYDTANRTLVRDFELNDPLYLEKPYSGRDISDIASEDYQTFDCVDLSGANNQRPD